MSCAIRAVLLLLTDVLWVEAVPYLLLWISLASAAFFLLIFWAVPRQVSPGVVFLKIFFV